MGWNESPRFLSLWSKDWLDRRNNQYQSKKNPKGLRVDSLVYICNLCPLAMGFFSFEGESEFTPGPQNLEVFWGDIKKDSSDKNLPTLQVILDKFPELLLRFYWDPGLAWSELGWICGYNHNHNKVLMLQNTLQKLATKNLPPNRMIYQKTGLIFFRKWRLGEIWQFPGLVSLCEVLPEIQDWFRRQTTSLEN